MPFNINSPANPFLCVLFFPGYLSREDLVISILFRILDYYKLKIKIMAQSTKTKRCSKCNEVKSTSQFSKSVSSKTGLQGYCTQCKKITHSEYMKSNKNGIIYRIVNPLDEVYIGCTKKKAHLRWNDHKSIYRFQSQRGYSTLPQLHKSFTMWGVDAHKFEIVKDCGSISKEDLREVESKMIIALKSNGKSLNINN